MILFLLMMTAAAGLFFLARKLSVRKEKYDLGLESFMMKSKRYRAVVLDVNDVPVGKDGETVRAVILQFRDEEKKSTIVHRYTSGTGKRYYRGSEVEVYYCEETDTACIKGDNPFAKKADTLRFFSVLCRISAAMLIISAILLLIF